ncbi:MAG: hypothetical protein QXS61_07845 [Candidatus Korarchaeum sp.]
MEDVKRVLSVLEAYASILPGIAWAVSYLMYLVAALLGSISASMTIELLGVQGAPSMSIIYGISLSILFIIVSAGIIRLWRVFTILEAFRTKSEAKYGIHPLLLWPLAFIVAAVVTLLVRASFPQSVALFVSLGTGLGNLLMALVTPGKEKYGPLLVGVYLIGTIPSYYYLPGIAVSLLFFHLSLPYLAVSLWYIFEGQRTATVILHAARGGNKEGN